MKVVAHKLVTKTLSGAKKYYFQQMRFVLSWGPKPKLDNGFEARLKAVGEDLENSPYFLPWAQVGTDKDYGMAQKHFLQ